MKKDFLPKDTNNPGALYSVENKSEAAKKISDIVSKSNILLRDSLLGQPKTPEQIADYIDADIVED
ncbi:MAG: hypothetical protein IKU45_02740 [Clostridia bacterium]|nr:hypothetical protein [Clostridia bacterium]